MIGGATLVAAGGGAAAWWTLFRRPAGVSANTVAVLPFDNVSGQAGQTYFAEGLSAEVRAALARNAVLRVVGQTSSDVFRNHAEDAKAISRKLGVAFLLDGNVRQSGNRVRISAELIDGQTGFSRWSQTFDRGLDDIFAVQTEIAGAVTSALTDEVGAAAQAQYRVARVEREGAAVARRALEHLARFEVERDDVAVRDHEIRGDEEPRPVPVFALDDGDRLLDGVEHGVGVRRLRGGRLRGRGLAGLGRTRGVGGERRDQHGGQQSGTRGEVSGHRSGLGDWNNPSPE
jgi:TolB-like protein